MPSLKDKDILVIEDAFDTRMLVKKILVNDGARVLEAEDVDHGLEIGATKAAQLILLDLGLPGKTGFDFLKAKKESPILKDIPVIIFSGNKDKDSIVKSLSLGASDYILKPFRASLILQKTRNALRVSSLQSYKFAPLKAPRGTLSINAEILKFNEGGCQIETNVRLSPQEKFQLVGEVLEKLGLKELQLRVLPNNGKFMSSGRNQFDVRFIGMSEDLAKRLRAQIKDSK